MTDDRHPDFLAAAPERQWAKSLAELAVRLREEAWKLKGGEAWYVLPRGAIIGLRINPETFRKELRLTRHLRRPWTDKSQAMWEREVGVFLEQLGCISWTCTKNLVEDDSAVGVDGPLHKVEAVYVEPAPLGAKRATLTCARCRNDFEPHRDDKLYREPICTGCAIALGDEEVAKRQAEAVSSNPQGGGA